MKKFLSLVGLLITINCILGLASCCVYKNSASAPISIEDLNIGMDKESVLTKYGQPFSFDVQISGNDTITTTSYKTPKPVANCEYIVTTKLLFVNNKLKSIYQSEFLVPDSVIYCDSSKVILKKTKQ